LGPLLESWRMCSTRRAHYWIGKDRAKEIRAWIKRETTHNTKHQPQGTKTASHRTKTTNPQQTDTLPPKTQPPPQPPKKPTPRPATPTTPPPQKKPPGGGLPHKALICAYPSWKSSLAKFRCRISQRAQPARHQGPQGEKKECFKDSRRCRRLNPQKERKEGGARQEGKSWGRNDSKRKF